MSLVLDTAEVAAADRADALHGALRSAVLPSRVDVVGPRAAVHARIEAWRLGAGADLVRVESSGHRLAHTARHLRGGAPEQLSLAVQLRGEGRLTHRDVLGSCRPGALHLTDLTSAFDYVSGPDSTAVVLQVDTAALGLPVDVVRRAVPGIASAPLHDLVHEHLRQLRRVADRIEGTPEAMTVGAATVELVRALVRSAADPGARDPLPPDALHARITASLRHRLGDADLHPARIAAEHHVSVRYLHLLFARQGESVGRWLVRERLEAARAALAAAPHAPVAPVARRVGFTDPGHFARRFRNAYGVSPRDWQRSHVAESGGWTSSPTPWAAGCSCPDPPPPS